MRKIQSFFGMALLLIAGTITFVSCNKTFDEPPAPSDPTDTSLLNHVQSIRSFRARHTIPGQIELITDDVVLSGVVCSSDKSGNIYKYLYIQDGTSAIQLNLDQASLYTTYPLGRRVFIKCKGLALTDINNMVQLGIMDYTTPASPTFQSIPIKLIPTYVVGGSLGNPVTAYVVKASKLTTSMQDTLQGNLITVENYAFDDTTQTYADISPAKNTVNLTVTGCDGKQLIIRTSGYANFAGLYPPGGRGSISAIYTVYRTTPQLILRDTSDVQLTNPRNDCPTTPATLITITELRNLYAGSDVSLDALKIRGVVISDVISKNTPSNNLVVQNGDKGVVLYFPGGTITNSVGDSVEINVSGANLTNYKGAIEVSMPPGSLAPTTIATGKFVTPKVYTIAALNSAISVTPLSASIENTLVKIVNATASASTFGSAKTLTDATGSIAQFTTGTATFSGTTIPAGATTWTGIAAIFNTPELKPRNANDVQ